MDALYFIKDGNSARRIDSLAVIPMRQAGYTILKMLVDGSTEHVQELKPDEELPDDFVQTSHYGMVLLLQNESEAKEGE